MPETGYELVRQRDLESDVGYDFCSEWFGPPPGVRRDEKDHLDCMNDHQFFACFLKWGIEKQQSLMVSEKQRRRTFRVVKWKETRHERYLGGALAKTGFFYTGSGDRTQC